jgi:decaprenylphospho-beta-D-ribofuranose 2-oxidase
MKLVSIVLCILCFFSPVFILSNADLVINDVSRLNPIIVSEVYSPNSYESLIEIVKQVSNNNQKISISGAKHSQGGHIAFPNSVHINMRRLNKPLFIDIEKKIIRIQSGATWEELQDYINPLGLSVKVMQSSGIFTIGGSLSVNCHGRDPRFGPVIETVLSFRLLTSNGLILSVSRDQHKELFQSVIGGYGLLGIILDVDISLMKNEVYGQLTTKISFDEYSNYILNFVWPTSNIGLHFGRLSIAPKSLLKDMYITDYVKGPLNNQQNEALLKEKYIKRNKMIFDLSRHSDLGKSLRWKLQLQSEQRIAKQNINGLLRNVAMRPPVRFLEYYSEKDTDILQEYFIPIESFPGFINAFRKLVVKSKINLLSVTTRFMRKNKESVLSYSHKDTIAIVIYVNQGLSSNAVEKSRVWTRKLIDIAFKNGGTYYLTYQEYPSKKQFKQHYPSAKKFNIIKHKIDPDNVFFSEFYSRYLK